MSPPSSPPTSASVPVLQADEIDAAEFQEAYVRPGRPLLLRDAMRDWRALERWQDPEYLAQAAGERTAQASDPTSGSRSQVQLAAYWRGIFAGAGAKHSSINAAIVVRGRAGALGNLKPDTALTPLLPAARHVATKVFAGHDSRCGLHYHPDTEACLFQVVGRKRVLLFPPDDRSGLYPIEWHSPYVTFSKANFSRRGDWPDALEYPAFGETHPLECEVRPGDMLYIPIYWWHVIFGLQTAICTTQFFRSSLRKRYLSSMGLRCNYLNRVGGVRLRLQTLLRRPGA